MGLYFYMNLSVWNVYLIRLTIIIVLIVNNIEDKN